MNLSRIQSIVKLAGFALVLLALAASLAPAALAAPDGALLTGTVKSAAGAKMGGVTVSAKMENTTITTSVFTDEEGAYYFPAMNSGHYQVWAQADGFDTARGSVDLMSTRHEDFVLNYANSLLVLSSGKFHWEYIYAEPSHSGPNVGPPVALLGGL